MFLTPQDIVSIKIDTYGTGAEVQNSFKAVGVPEARPVIVDGGAEFKLSKYKYHMFPGFPEVNVAMDMARIVKNELPRSLADQIEYYIGAGTSAADTGLMLKIPAPHKTVIVNLGVWTWETERDGAQAVLENFRKSLVGSGAYE